MKPRVMALRDDLRATTADAREAAAAKLYELNAVRSAMSSQAKAGFDYALIAAPDGLDLRGTAAAVEAMAWLAKHGFDSAWEPRAGGTGEDGATSYSLRISWKPPALKP